MLADWSINTYIRKMLPSRFSASPVRPFWSTPRFSVRITRVSQHAMAALPAADDIVKGDETNPVRRGRARRISNNLADVANEDRVATYRETVKRHLDRHPEEVENIHFSVCVKRSFKKQKKTTAHPLDLKGCANKLQNLGSHQRFVQALIAIEPELRTHQQVLDGMTNTRLAVMLAFALHCELGCAVPSKRWEELVSIWCAWYIVCGSRLQNPQFVNVTAGEVDWDYSAKGVWTLGRQGDDGMEVQDTWNVLIHVTGQVVPLDPPLEKVWTITQNYMEAATLQKTGKRKEKLEVMELVQEALKASAIIPRLFFDRVDARPSQHVLAATAGLPMLTDGSAASSSKKLAIEDGSNDCEQDDDQLMAGLAAAIDHTDSDDDAPAGYGGTTFA